MAGKTEAVLYVLKSKRAKQSDMGSMQSWVKEESANKGEQQQEVRFWINPKLEGDNQLL